MHQYPHIESGKSASTGWSELPLADGLAARHSALVTLKEQLYAEFQPLCAQRLDDKSALDVEILKSAVRAIIRYSPEAKDFTIALARWLISVEPRWGSYFVTPPYLIFHLPSDKFEAGSIHMDTIRECGGMFTCWTPINERQLTYSALTFFEGSHALVPRVAYKVFRKLRLARWLADETFLARMGVVKADLSPNRKCSYFWDSNLLHLGNLNPEAQAHCSVVYRVCRNPLYYEPANRCADVAGEAVADDPKVSLAQLAPVLDEMASLAARAPDLSVYSEAVRKWVVTVRDFRLSLDTRLSKHCSFASSLIAQRFDGQTFAPAFYLMSYVMGKENLVSLERFFASCKGSSAIENYLTLLAELTPIDTFQERVLLNKVRKGARRPVAEYDSRERLLTWMN